MEIEIITFGKITEFLGKQRMEITGISNTDELKSFLENSYPTLKRTKYKLALNKNIVQESTIICNNDTIAVMPPFSGG